MKTAGVAKLKARLSLYLEQVRAGQELLITDRGRPIAKLVPLRASEQPESRRERLARAGLVRLGRGRLRPAFLKPPRGPRVGAGVLRALLAERAETR